MWLGHGPKMCMGPQTLRTSKKYWEHYHWLTTTPDPTCTASVAMLHIYLISTNSTYLPFYYFIYLLTTSSKFKSYRIYNYSYIIIIIKKFIYYFWNINLDQFIILLYYLHLNHFLPLLISIVLLLALNESHFFLIFVRFLHALPIFLHLRVSPSHVVCD